MGVGKKIPVKSEIDKLNDVLKDTVWKIDQGKLDVKKKKVQHFSTEKKLPLVIKDAKEYVALSENMKYSSKYATELSRLYKDAMAPKKAMRSRELRCFLAVVE